jgi:hypothetical protein
LDLGGVSFSVARIHPLRSLAIAPPFLSISLAFAATACRRRTLPRWLIASPLRASRARQCGSCAAPRTPASAARSPAKRCVGWGTLALARLRTPTGFPAHKRRPPPGPRPLPRRRRPRGQGTMILSGTWWTRRTTFWCPRATTRMRETVRAAFQKTSRGEFRQPRAPFHHAPKKRNPNPHPLNPIQTGTGSILYSPLTGKTATWKYTLMASFPWPPFTLTACS